MGPIKLLARAVRRIIGFPLVQLLIVVAVILLLQAADENSIFGNIFNGLDKLVDFTVQLSSSAFTVKSFTKSWLTFSFMIVYVYLACLLILYVLRLILAGIVYLIALTNAFGLRNAIARERGIVAYRAWLPFERIRPNHISQKEWEETFAWPPDDKPPYPSLFRRMVGETLSYVVLLAGAAILLQLFTPFPAVVWLGELARYLVSSIRSR
jgi:chromate transport protein ChrA